MTLLEPPPVDGAGRWIRTGVVTHDQARVIERLVGASDPDRDTLVDLVLAGVITASQASAVGRGHAGGNGYRLAVNASPRSSPSADSQAAEPSRRPLPRLSVDADRLGLVLAAVACLGLAWAAIEVAAGLLMMPRKPLGAELVDGTRLLACLLALIGGRRMYRGAQRGKPLVLTGIALYFLITAATSLRRPGDALTVTLLASLTVLYYLTAASRLRPTRPDSSTPEPVYDPARPLRSHEDRVPDLALGAQTAQPE